jgi:Rieske Fe-S protein
MQQPPDDGAEQSESAGCESCPIAPTRRRFLQEAAVAVAGVLVTVGVSRHVAAQLPVETITALARRGGARSYPIPSGDVAQIDRDNEVILVRWEGVVYAFNLSCPHQRTALRWSESAHRFQCPKHHSQYEPSGEFITGRATRGMDRFAVRRDGQNVLVDTETLYRQDENAAAWRAAALKLTN